MTDEQLLNGTYRPDPLDEYIRLTSQSKRRDRETERFCFEPSVSGPYDTHFDFDESSRAWKQNKREPWKGIFRYRCDHYSATKGKYCRNTLFLGGPYCKHHFIQSVKEQKQKD